MDILEIIKALIIGVVEGITEWLPISSTGHMLLVERFIPFNNASEEFKEMFNVVIQLGAILAVCIMYFDRLNPFSRRKTPARKRDTWQLWMKVIIGCIPAMILGLLLDDWLDAHFYNAYVVATMLIIYGILFIVLESINKKKSFRISTTGELSYKTALAIGAIQCLAMIPGTSRSGVTILGAMALGVARTAAAEFSFFVSIPIMFGASFLKIVKFIVKGGTMSGNEIGIMVVGIVVAFVVSLLAIGFLMSYIKKHDFSIFGYYRIILGVILLMYFL